MNNYYNFFQKIKSKKHTINIVLIICLLIIFLSPKVYYQVGNIFFGQVSALYNVNLAQNFYTYASYPLFGKPTPYAHHQLSRTYFIQGELEKALKEAQIEIDTYPENIRSYYILALTYGYMDQEEQAIEAFSKFIDANPVSWAGRNDKAWLQFRIGDVDGALETIEPVVWDEGNPWVQNTYGTILLNMGRYDDAKKAFELAQKALSSMTEDDWGKSYPGNDPRIYEMGFKSMEKSINSNIKLLESL